MYLPTQQVPLLMICLSTAETSLCEKNYDYELVSDLRYALLQPTQTSPNSAILELHAICIRDNKVLDTKLMNCHNKK